MWRSADFLSPSLLYWDLMLPLFDHGTSILQPKSCHTLFGRVSSAVVRLWGVRLGSVLVHEERGGHRHSSTQCSTHNQHYYEVSIFTLPMQRRYRPGAEEVRQAPAHAPCGPSFNCMFDIPRLLYVSRDTLCICKLAILVHTPLRKLVLVAA